MKITNQALSFSKRHIEKYYDSDFFPLSDVFENIWAVWPQVESYLLNTDIENLEIITPKKFAAPKSHGGYRIVHQLDPLNQLVYTALAYMIADEVEKKRIDKSKKAACSYRILTTDEGDFFEYGNGYDDFRDKSVELAQSNKFVLITDITDFYNQIYVHRIQNAIETSNKTLREISKVIEGFLLKLNNSSSKGIPVGPAASIVLSEAILMDIDQYIENKGLEFTRYVDDIRIFSNNEIELDVFLLEITEYLYENHRLNLSSSKTRIITTTEFIQKEIDDPSNIEKNEIKEQLSQINYQFNGEISGVNAVDPINDINELDPLDKSKVQNNALSEIMDRIVTKEHIDLGLTRHILRRAKSLRCRSIYNSVLDNFDFFNPALRDVVLYLDKVTNDKSFALNRDKYISIIEKSRSINYPYTKYWINWFITGKDFIYKDPYFRKYLKAQDRIWNIRIQIEQQNIAYIRDLKNQYENAGIWEKYGILKSFTILPSAERSSFLNCYESRLTKTEFFITKSLF